MIKKILRYYLPSQDCTVIMPAGAQILNVQVQGDKIVAYALAVSWEEDEPRHFQGFYTEDAVPDDMVYVSTILAQDGYVYHVFVDQPSGSEIDKKIDAAYSELRGQAYRDPREAD